MVVHVVVSKEPGSDVADLSYTSDMADFHHTHCSSNLPHQLAKPLSSLQQYQVHVMTRREDKGCQQAELLTSRTIKTCDLIMTVCIK